MLKFVKPKIGIRPAIDGRRKGIRESLEEQTMQMATSAAALISANLCYMDGTPVECVIADTTIGGVAESARCKEKFDHENVCATLTVTPCWCYGTETMDMDPLTQKAVWGFNGTERPGAVYLAAVLAAHSQKGLPAFGIYGHDVQDADDKTIPADVSEKILRFARAAIAVGEMKDKSYLSMGNVAMGIGGSVVNSDFFQKYLGMRTEYVDMSEIIRRLNLGIYDHDEFEKALAWTKENCKEGIDTNIEEWKRSKEEKDKEWETIVKMTIISRDLIEGNEKLAEMGYVEESNGHNAILSGFQGQRNWTDFMPNGDFTEAISNSSFDWNGKRAPRVLATENDSLNGVAMLFGYLLTNTAQVFCDVRTYWSPEAIQRVTGKLPESAKDGFIHLVNSGAAALDGTGCQTEDGKPVIKPFWKITDKEVKDCLDATVWSAANYGYFRGGGFSSNFYSKGGMPMTMCRVNIVEGLGPMLQIAEGYSIDMPEEVWRVIDDRTDRTWPTTWFVPRLTGTDAFRDTYSVMANWGANHCALSYGHIGADLITLASMLRIPVAMHNVCDTKLFRPSTWSAFGTKDAEGADYRACSALGPVYGKKKF